MLLLLLLEEAVDAFNVVVVLTRKDKMRLVVGSITFCCEVVAARVDMGCRVGVKLETVPTIHTTSTSTWQRKENLSIMLTMPKNANANKDTDTAW
jgi:hypothetical protein